MTRKQCAKCPWKVSTNPHEIPRGYSEEKHQALACTIAEPGAITPAALGGGTLRIMACHDTHNLPCVGWLANQLGPGNNIALRLQCRFDRSLGDFETVGEQHETFEQTLPKKKSKP